MKIITVDFANMPPIVTDRYAGEIGEHQAVTLKIIPEKAMSEDEDLQFYYVLFAVEGGLVASRTFSQGEEISIALWEQLTENRKLKFQLIGTNGGETIIAKSPVLTVMLGDSLVGTVIGIDDNRDSLIAMIGAFNERVGKVETDIAPVELVDTETSATQGTMLYTGTEINAMLDEGANCVIKGNYIISRERDAQGGVQLFYTFEPTRENGVARHDIAGYKVRTNAKTYVKSPIRLTPDPTPTDGSFNPARSDGVYNALQNILPTVTSADAGKVLTVDENGNWVAI